jgi:hypothetical protein
VRNFELSIDDRPDYEEKLQWTCANIHLGKDQLWEALMEFPSIQFGLKWRSSLYTAKLFFYCSLPIYWGQNQFNQWSRLDG